ncbi:hypothetical protein Glove_87g201 [Diversispora epigaea]|uniref:Uncharacterized protein n=1 Tax=Diversispora epigaea TaxID=1348612 RepID=A0A397JCU3_9GLOM|nr:hypothetical protein Glove_87g201 [Diversispora epigaea]
MKIGGTLIFKEINQTQRQQQFRNTIITTIINNNNNNNIHNIYNIYFITINEYNQQLLPLRLQQQFQTQQLQIQLQQPQQNGVMKSRSVWIIEGRNGVRPQILNVIGRHDRICHVLHIFHTCVSPRINVMYM